jgi:nitrate/nitrite transporter NarK
MFLALYCIFLLFSGGKDIPSLAIAPFIYSIIIPILLFFSLPLLYLLAYSLYGDRLFIKRITGTLIASVVIALFVLVFVNLLRNSLPELFLQLSNISSLYQFEESDIMFIFISLIEVAITSLYSARAGSSKIESIDNWFRQIAMNGFIGMFWMVGALLFALPIAGIADLFNSDQARIAFLFLFGFYLVFVYLRWRILRNEKSSPSKELAEEKIASK